MNKKGKIISIESLCCGNGLSHRKSCVRKLFLNKKIKKSSNYIYAVYFLRLINFFIVIKFVLIHSLQICFYKHNINSYIRYLSQK